MPLDARLPCVPAFVWPYLLGLALPLVPAWLMPARLLARTFAAYGLLIAGATFVFVVAPTEGHTLRAQCAAAPGWVLETVQRSDPAANLFPSLHVGFAMLATLCAAHAGSRWTPFLAAATLIEAVSACLVKQHYAADVLAGPLLALAAYAAAFARSGAGGAIQPWSSRKMTSRQAMSSSGGSESDVGEASRAAR